jgi:hypothetical protein
LQVILEDLKAWKSPLWLSAAMTTTAAAIAIACSGDRADEDLRFTSQA